MTSLLSILVAVALAFATGLALVCVLLPRPVRQPTPLLLLVSLYLGLALHSVIYFIWATWLNEWNTGWLWLDLLLFLALLMLNLQPRPQRTTPSPAPLEHAASAPRLPRLASWIVLGLGLWLAAQASVSFVSREPLGRWDAQAMWNAKARMLYAAPPNIHAAYSDLGDYPVLLPATIARLWRYSGSDAWFVPQGVAVAATLSLALLLAVGLAHLRSWPTAAAGTLALLSSLPLIQQGAIQYADVPLALYMLLALAALACWFEWRDRTWLVIAGLAAGAAAWTKNEGLTFCFWVVLTVAVLSRSRRRSLLLLLLSAALFLIPAFMVKGLHSGISSIHRVNLATLVERAADPQRWTMIIRATLNSLNAVFYWPALLLLLAAAIASSSRRIGQPWRSALLIATIAAAQLTTYLFFYLLLSPDLGWHLQTSSHRLIVQLWPATCLAIALASSTTHTHRE